jgi:hypothetical protein
MAEHIYDPNEPFDFSQLKLTPPTLLTGGHHFIKYVMRDFPLYLQTGKCCTKQGIVKAGKKMYCDLVFTNEHESFIRWLENLEEYSQKYIFDHRSQWFETGLEMHDIENSFTSPIKLYKSGKYYLLRVNIPMRLGKCTLKVYDEDETPIDIDTIRDTTQVYTILEMQGIRCSARSFQIEVEMKQMMVLKPSNLFERCVISRGGAAATTTISTKQSEPFSVKPDTVSESVPELLNENKDTDGNMDYVPYDGNMDYVPCDGNMDGDRDGDYVPDDGDGDMDMDRDGDYVPDDGDGDRDGNMDYVPDDGNGNGATDVDGLDLEEIEEIDITETEMTTAPVHIKDRNDVYYEMYLTAKRKAEAAREAAVQSFLEVKRIQQLYRIHDPDTDPGTKSGADEIVESL